MSVPTHSRYAKRSRVPSQKSDCEMADVADSEYFESYADLSIHTFMLKDEPRMRAYRDALVDLSDKIRGRVVMDVGCGTGILSMLCAKICAPSKVIAVEATPSTARIAELLVARNGLEGIISVVCSPVENVELEPGFMVDVIVSEWMGFYLLHESMLDSVLFARDKFLKPRSLGGLMLPSSASIYAAAIQTEDQFADKCDVWMDFMGLNLSALAECELMRMVRSPQICTLSPVHLLSAPVLLSTLDLLEISSGDLDCISASLRMPVVSEGKFSAVAIWFSCGFDGPVTLSTSPLDPVSHWQQTAVFLGCRSPVGPGVEIECKVTLKRGGREQRAYDISVET